jgi:hypothetical protein
MVSCVPMNENGSERWRLCVRNMRQLGGFASCVNGSTES